MPDSDPLDNPTYQEFLADCAIGCRACSRCWDVPCAACCAGGICDAICHCSSELDDRDIDDWSDDDG